jgi:hypothetical protein
MHSDREIEKEREREKLSENEDEERERESVCRHSLTDSYPSLSLFL